VATTGGALPEVVGSDGSTGLLVEPGNPEALAGAIRRILDDDALAARLGEGGRRRVLGRFTWQATASGTAGQYHALLEERAAPLHRPKMPVASVTDATEDNGDTEDEGQQKERVSC